MRKDLYIFCIFYLTAYTFAFIPHQQSSIIKRQAIASRACGNENNTISICSPSSGSVWYNDTDQEITWKWNNPTLLHYDTLDLYLLYKNDTTATTFQVVKTWPELERTKGVLVQHIDDTWYPSEMDFSTTNNISWTMFFYIVGSGYDIQSDLDLIPTRLNFFPVPQVFTLIQSARNTTATEISPSAYSPNNDTNHHTSQTSTSNHVNNLPGWAIAVIVIVVLIVIAATAALIWALRYKNRTSVNDKFIISKKNGGSTDDEKLPVLLAATNKTESNVMIHSAVSGITTTTTATPVPAATVSTVRTTIRSTSSAAINKQNDASTSPLKRPSLADLNDQQQSSSILSSTDALMIADTFRQFMRKPDWNEELDVVKK
ncbi:hypothetical protein BDF20DRAFT_996375 [Mycotypha africana]|uniref:uncharacterized protein n=1 Tax=Mycotypha africana TaxID=64632 RepID=UPI0023014D0F|nr:uncharacterized protein BDF20DRAFT_996375 [Mycotypha africana]KAI8968564.1 hypothetical protein BDF20DRAFT_996375 [Mycotypha africana]